MVPPPYIYIYVLGDTKNDLPFWGSAGSPEPTVWRGAPSEPLQRLVGAPSEPLPTPSAGSAEPKKGDCSWYHPPKWGFLEGGLFGTPSLHIYVLGDTKNTLPFLGSAAAAGGSRRHLSPQNLELFRGPSHSAHPGRDLRADSGGRRFRVQTAQPGIWSFGEKLRGFAWGRDTGISVCPSTGKGSGHYEQAPNRH